MNLADVRQVERVGTAREARRHRVLVGLEPNTPLRAALATDLVVVFDHPTTVTAGCDRLPNLYRIESDSRGCARTADNMMCS